MDGAAVCAPVAYEKVFLEGLVERREALADDVRMNGVRRSEDD